MGRKAPEEGRAGTPPRNYISVWPWRSFCSLFFLAGTSPSLRGGTEDARNSQPPLPPSSWPPLQDGRLGTVSSPGVSGSPAALEFERSLLESPLGGKLQGPWVCLPQISRGTLGSGVWKFQPQPAFHAAHKHQAL